MAQEMEDDEVEVEIPKKWASIEPLLTRPGAFTREGFEPNPGNIENIQNARVLVVGAGGLGCELLKNLALSGFTDISVIDLDTIDVSNLNRQFLFRMKDVGKYKCEVAAEFIMSRCKNVTVKWHNKPIQEFPPSFYRSFDIVIAGLDNIEARSWLNETLVDLVKFDKDGDVDWDSVIPLIDGGTEGFRGQTRLFIPRVTSCFECSLQSMAEQTSFPLCTIANVPRRPEHCIAYALKLLWPRLEKFNSPTDYKLRDSEEGAPGSEHVKLDKDDVNHMSWLFLRAEERAKQFGIEGVTFNLTMQVVKNIIPAIASTNAVVSAACANEAVKYLSWSSQQLHNYYMYMGHSGVYTETINYQRNKNCRVCHQPSNLKMSKNDTFGAFLEKLQKEGVGNVRTVSSGGEMLYTVISEKTKPVSDKPLPEVVKKSGQLLSVTSDLTKDGAVKKVLVVYK